MQFEILEHPADIGFRAYGSSLEDVFANCAHALISIILDPTEVGSSQHWKFSAEGSDIESLLVNWLNEVLYYVDTRRIAFHSFSISFTARFQVTCEASGEPRDRLKHPVRVAVKAITYHQLRVSKIGATWSAEVYVDV